MRDDLPKAHREQGQSFIEAERIAQVLRDFKERLDLLTRGRDGVQKVHGRFVRGLDL